MKQIIAIVLASCILFFNTGWTLTTHYCMGERIGSYLEHSGSTGQSHECPKCGMTKTGSDNGCCEDESVVLKASDVATLTFFNVQIDPLWADLPMAGASPFYAEATLLDTQSTGIFQPHGPPIYNGPPLFIKNCVFLI